MTDKKGKNNNNDIVMRIAESKFETKMIEDLNKVLVELLDKPNRNTEIDKILRALGFSIAYTLFTKYVDDQRKIDEHTMELEAFITKSSNEIFNYMKVFSKK